MRRERLLARDEAALLGDCERFWKLMLKSVRSSRTQARNLLAYRALAAERWSWLPDEEFLGDTAAIEASIVRCDEMEELALRELAACRDAVEESLG